MDLICSRHGITKHRLSVKKWKCKKCEYLYSKRYIEKLTIRAFEYAGGKCKLCGYNKCIRSLHFHHVDPKTKEFNIFEFRSGYKKIRNWEKLKIEIDKCVLLCGNCHMELHSKDDIILHEEIKIKLTRTDIEYLNKSIINKVFTPEKAIEMAINIINNKKLKLSVKELRHQEWMIRNVYSRLDNQN